MNAILKWLESDNGHQALLKLARGLLNDSVVISLFRRFTADDPFGTEIQDPDGILAELLSELTCFLLESREQIRQAAVLPENDCSRLIRAGFVNYLKDRLRTPGKDPYSYLYRRIVTVLRESDGFFVRSKTRAGTAYSSTSDSMSIPPLVREDLTGISFPFEMLERLAFEEVNKKRRLLALATVFWDAVSRLAGGAAAWVDVRDLVAWIAMHVPLAGPQACRPGVSDKDREEWPFDRLETASRDPELGTFDVQKIKTWAGNMAARLNQKQALALVLSHGEGLSLEQIAQNLHLRGPSGAAYHVERAESVLRDFLRDLPWLSPPDLNEDAFSLFWETLASFLKKRTAKP